MRRLTVVSLVVIAAFALMTPLALAGMRVNRVNFTAIGGSGDLTTLATASRKATTLAATSSADCTASSPCIGLALNAQGFLTGVSSSLADGSVIQLIARGVPVDITCRNNGGNTAPGISADPITATGEELLDSTTVTKNGKAPIDLTATFTSLTFPGKRMGCPNDNWTATVNAVRFTCATIQVTQGTTVVLKQSYNLDGSCTA